MIPSLDRPSFVSAVTTQIRESIAIAACEISTKIRKEKLSYLNVAGNYNDGPATPRKFKKMMRRPLQPPTPPQDKSNFF
jgi:uncharacterized protein (UPF0212 family)